MKWLKRLFGAGILAGVAYALWRALDERAREGPLEWRPQPFAAPPMPVPVEAEADPPSAPSAAVATRSTEDAAPATDAPWVESRDGTCPATHPVKGKRSSGIFHLPGGQLYDRTIPDRCYRDPAAAEADGLRASKR